MHTCVAQFSDSCHFLFVRRQPRMTSLTHLQSCCTSLRNSGTTMTFLRVTPAWRQKKNREKTQTYTSGSLWGDERKVDELKKKKEKKAFEAEDDCLKMPRKHVEFENSRRLVSFDERASPRAHSVRTTDVTRSSAFERHSSRTRQRRRLWFHSLAQSTAFLP